MNVIQTQFGASALYWGTRSGRQNGLGKVVACGFNEKDSTGHDVMTCNPVNYTTLTTIAQTFVK